MKCKFLIGKGFQQCCLILTATKSRLGAFLNGRLTVSNENFFNTQVIHSKFHGIYRVPVTMMFYLRICQVEFKILTATKSRLGALLNGRLTVSNENFFKYPSHPLKISWHLQSTSMMFYLIICRVEFIITQGTRPSTCEFIPESWLKKGYSPLSHKRNWPRPVVFHDWLALLEPTSGINSQMDKHPKSCKLNFDKIKLRQCFTLGFAKM